MKRRILCSLGILATGMVLAGAAAADSDSDSDSDRSKSRYQTANVWDAAVGPGNNVGAAWLVREKNAIRGRIMANVPQAGIPYTVWFIVVNKPSACVDLFCLFGPSDDFGNPATRTTIFNATGAIGASNGLGGGVVNADFDVEAGKLPNGWFVLSGDHRALLRSRGFKSLVWIIIDQHPEITSGSMESWIEDLTTTEPPGGSVTSVSLALFMPCPGKSCPPSAL